MAEDLAREEPRFPPAEADVLVPLVPARREGGAHRVRFGLAYLALAAVAGAALGTTVVVLDRPGKTAGPEWSSWQPSGDRDAHPRQIADHVSQRYRRPSGTQLVAVTYAGEPQVQQVPLSAVAIQTGGDGSDSPPKFVQIENGLMYNLCGLGPSCAFPEGELSEGGLQLLRREALELALYSFKYAGADSVIALLPPNVGNQQDPDDDTSRTLFFQKRDLARELERPLRTTLLAPEQPQPAEIDPDEGLIIDRLTQPRLFQYEIRQAQEGSAFLILAPLVGG
ncbi:MAG: hypothetical protein H0T39_09425 [Actinobacteria bacterium]|nr:hypothetical protein [Actinomycetota bacterium]